MNPLEKALTWIDILLDPSKNRGLRPFKQGKHAQGNKRSPNAREQRRLKNKHQRQARMASYRRMKI